MQVTELKLAGFRNYRQLSLEFGERINIFYGRNAQGKTNILEAISLLATTRSLRASRESELILRGEESGSVTAEVDREKTGDAELSVSVFQGDKKAVRVNGSKRERVVDLLGQFNAVFFGSIDLAIITGEPADRRHYLNVEISQISPRYVHDLGHYKRALAQRNRLLKELRDRPRPPQELGLDIWNQQLVRYGAPIVHRRRFYLERLAILAEQVHSELSDGRERLEVRYLPSIVLPEAKPPMAEGVVRETREEAYLHAVEVEAPDTAEVGDEVGDADRITSLKQPDSPSGGPQEVEEAFKRQMERIGLEEARRGTTLLGPQRDDVAFFINGQDARLYGSQGQQRTVALALKLAEFQLIQEQMGEPPVMLLDDVMSDLDDHRRKHLLQWVRRRCQTFITCTNLRSFPKDLLAEACVFQVDGGSVTLDVRYQPVRPEAAESPDSDSTGLVSTA